MKNFFVHKIYSKGTIRRVKRKISALGVNSKVSLESFLFNKLLILVLTFAGSLLLFDFEFIIAICLTIAVYFLFDYAFLELPIRKRIKVLEKDAIFFFEVLSLTMQSERNLKLCLENTCEVIDSDLSSEFKEVLKEVKIGKSLTEALTDAKTRIPSKSVNNVLLNIIESNVYGTSIIDALHNQIEYLTDKRILDIKAQINKMPTKISIVSVIFFIPLILLLIMGPLAISYFFK